MLWDLLARVSYPEWRVLSAFLLFQFVKLSCTVVVVVVIMPNLLGMLIGVLIQQIYHSLSPVMQEVLSSKTLKSHFNVNKRAST